MKRSDHAFEFSAGRIAEAAKAEAEYHEGRFDHWKDRAAAALEIVKDTIGAKVVERAVTGGQEVDVVVDYGDREAWAEYQLAIRKIKGHGEAAIAVRQDERTYGSQIAGRIYELDVDDVAYFRLGGEPRED